MTSWTAILQTLMVQFDAVSKLAEAKMCGAASVQCFSVVGVDDQCRTRVLHGRVKALEAQVALCEVQAAAQGEFESLLARDLVVPSRVQLLATVF